MARPSANLDFAQLAFLLTRLNFADNFESYIAQDVSLAASSETQIVYKLPSQKKAKYFIVLDQTGNGVLARGSTDWTSNYAYIHNYGATTVTATILLLSS